MENYKVYIDDDFVFDVNDITFGLQVAKRFVNDKLDNVRNNREYDYYNNAKFDVKLNNQLVARYIPDDFGNLIIVSNTSMLAPNGRNSNLPPDLYKIVRTVKFKQWFGDWENDPKNSSKVLDKNGEPLIVYHGTNATFDVFDSSLKGQRGSLRERFWCFSDNKKVAEFYAQNGNGTILQCFLNIRDMLSFDNGYQYYRDFKHDVGYKEVNVWELQDFIEHGLNDDCDGAIIVSGAKTIKRSSGFLIKNTIEMEKPSDFKTNANLEYLGNTYYVKDSNQIKRVDALSFSSSNNIRESKEVKEVINWFKKLKC